MIFVKIIRLFNSPTLIILDIKLKKLYFIVFILVPILLSCNNNFFSPTTKISDILASPSKYSDTVVSVNGKVTESLVFLDKAISSSQTEPE